MSEFQCPKCGGGMEGDGYTIVFHCENADCPMDIEPDADPIFCDFEEQVIDTIHPDRRYKNCLCCVCGKISKCTPANDFYRTEDHGEGLVCERCFNAYTG